MLNRRLISILIVSGMSSWMAGCAAPDPRAAVPRSPEALCSERIKTAFVWNENNYPKISATASIIWVVAEKGKFPYQYTTIGVHVVAKTKDIYIDSVFAKPALQAQALQFKEGQQIAIKGRVTSKSIRLPLNKKGCYLAVYEPDISLL